MKDLQEKSKTIACSEYSGGYLKHTSVKISSTVHLLLMIIEPQMSPYYNNYIDIHQEGTSCYKEKFIDKIRQSLSTTGKELVHKINLNRCTEDTYLEVKELRDEWLKSEEPKEKEELNA